MKTPMIETNRLILKEITLDAYEDYFTNVRQYDLLYKYFNKVAPTAASLVKEQIEEWTEKYKDHPYQWFIYLKGTGEVIGRIDLHNYRLDYKNADIGYELGPNYWHHGYMRETVEAVLKYLFRNTDIHLIQAITNIDNFYSQKVLLHTGFEKEAILHERDFIDGKYVPVVMWYTTAELLKKFGIDI